MKRILTTKKSEKQYVEGAARHGNGRVSIYMSPQTLILSSCLGPKRQKAERRMKCIINLFRPGRGRSETLGVEKWRWLLQIDLQEAALTWYAKTCLSSIAAPLHVDKRPCPPETQSSHIPAETAIRPVSCYHSKAAGKHLYCGRGLGRGNSVLLASALCSCWVVVSIARGCFCTAVKPKVMSWFYARTYCRSRTRPCTQW